MNLMKFVKTFQKFFYFIINDGCINCKLSKYNGTLKKDNTLQETLSLNNKFNNGQMIGNTVRIGGMSFQSLYKLNNNIFFSKIVYKDDKTNLLHLKNEYKILKYLLNEDYFCKAISFEENLDYYYLITERYSIDLFQYINRVNNPIHLTIIYKWINQLLFSFNILHRKYNIVHRDIKPDNIMINFEGNLIIIDFGLAKKEKYVSSAGTINYACPYMLEMAKYKSYGVVNGYKCDVWSLGVVLFNILTKSQLYDLDINFNENPIVKNGYYKFLDKFNMLHQNIDSERMKILKFLNFFFNEYSKRYKLITILIKFKWDFKDKLNYNDNFYTEFINSMNSINKSLLII